jgi:hypothetical protein
MSILLILLGLLIILVILRLFVVKEGFQDIPVSPTTVQQYNDFMAFYTPFCANWQKAIVSSVASEIPQQPLTDPSQVQTGSAPQISTDQMNQYITSLSQELGQPLPPICIPLPPTIDSSNMNQVIPLIPTDHTPYINALNWMNKHLSKAHSNLGGALKGNLSKIEGFDNCQNISQCLQNNPQLLEEIQQQNAQQNAQQQEGQLTNLIGPFSSNDALNDVMNINKDLVAKAEEIQKQAENGDLMKQINIPGGNTIAQYIMPEGASTLKDMEQTDPEKYNKLKDGYKVLFSLKQLLEGINSNLVK